VEIGEEFGVLRAGAENGFRALTSPRFGLETEPIFPKGQSRPEAFRRIGNEAWEGCLDSMCSGCAIGRLREIELELAQAEGTA